MGLDQTRVVCEESVVKTEVLQNNIWKATVLMAWQESILKLGSLIKKLYIFSQLAELQFMK